jgi:hypothetical protein
VGGLLSRLATRPFTTIFPAKELTAMSNNDNDNDNELEQSVDEDTLYDEAEGNPTDDEEDEIFDITLVEKPIKMRQSDGSVLKFKMRELVGKQRDEIMNLTSARMKPIAPGSNQLKVSDFRGLQAMTLAKCLVDEQTGNLVKPEVINSWPARVVEALHKKANKLSALDDNAKDEAKND